MFPHNVSSIHYIIYDDIKVDKRVSNIDKVYFILYLWVSNRDPKQVSMDPDSGPVLEIL